MPTQGQPQCACCTAGHTDPPGSDACETNCTTGTIPNTFELIMPTGAFNTFAGGCGADCLNFAGTFALDWFGDVGGICRWVYCGDDPCNPGDKFMYQFSYRTPGTAVLQLVYGLTDCSDTAWVNANEWTASIGGPGLEDCLFDVFSGYQILNWNLDVATPNCAIFDGTPGVNDGINPRIKALN